MYVEGDCFMATGTEINQLRALPWRVRFKLAIRLIFGALKA